MKKFVAGLFAALLLLAGLEMVSGAAAQAARPPAVAAKVSSAPRAACYPGKFNTTASITGPATVKKGKRATFVVKVKPASGSAKVNGTIRLRVRRNGEIFREVNRRYSGSPINIIFPGPAVLGSYNVFVKYFPVRCSVYRESPLVSTSFTVVK